MPLSVLKHSGAELFMRTGAAALTAYSGCCAVCADDAIIDFGGCCVDHCIENRERDECAAQNQIDQAEV